MNILPGRSKWGQALVRTLKPTGTFWLAIGDDFAAELKLIFQRELGLFCRSWVIWYYTFGVQLQIQIQPQPHASVSFCERPQEFHVQHRFHPRSLRAAAGLCRRRAPIRKGRLPDDTWILRPQDIADSFTPDEDTWHFPRVCGTFKERAGWHGCQMPEQLLGRIIKACSNPGETVLDPFGGSGTTLVVAKKLDRRFIGFELSKNYAEQIQARLNTALPGDPLSGADEPKTKAPPTALGKQRKISAPVSCFSLPNRKCGSPIIRTSTPVKRDATAGTDRMTQPPTVEQTREIWERIASWWDQHIGEGNDFQKTLIMPATDRLLDPKPGQTILDVACGNGNYSRSLGRRGAASSPAISRKHFSNVPAIEPPRTMARSNIGESTPPTWRNCSRSAKNASTPPSAAWP